MKGVFNEMISSNLELIVSGYLQAMLWSTGDIHPETGEQLESLEEFDLAPETEATATQICLNFYLQNIEDCRLFSEQYEPPYGENVWDCLGHDLWLTSAGHGVGFWDRDLDELGDILTGASKKFACECYLGDDLLVYLSK